MDCVEWQRVDLLAPGEVCQERIAQRLGLLTTFAVSPGRCTDRRREDQPLWDLARPRMAGHALLSRSWRAALSALGAWLSKYVKFPLSLGGRM